MAILLNGSRVKTRRAAGNFMAICPAHQDDTPSLGIRLGKNGKLMYRCHAGCTFPAIRKEIE
ncbi:CHC2 zinc finger domain-containing protein, partial [Stenotrophomonas maltophilia]|uniref:CHC2 zinc finger domain-containing protein n=1 Tax=Stenotrophomonas maltophilia TaxID=40324 RepID=UPI001952BBF6